MLLFLIKLYRTFRRALAARKYPSQFAWAIAFGLLLGLIPHGNLMAVATLVVILCLRINHPAMGLTAIGVTMVATMMDPLSHRVGTAILENDLASSWLAAAWTYPLVPWTDLNNTVVIGSMTIGLIALVPTFLITYPFFRAIAPKTEPSAELRDDLATDTAPSIEPEVAVASDLNPGMDRELGDVVIRRDAADMLPDPRIGRDSGVDSTRVQAAGLELGGSESEPAIAAFEFQEIPGEYARPQSVQSIDSGKGHAPASKGSIDGSPTEQDRSTRIDVVRMSPTGPPPPHRVDPSAKIVAGEDSSMGDPSGGNASKSTASNPEAMDEALNYLLHQLRNKTQTLRKGDAA